MGKLNFGRAVLNLKELGVESAFLLGKYSYAGAHTHLDTHVHENMIEIVYCAKGQQVYEVNGQQFEICGGDVFVTFPNEPHGTANYPEEKGSIYWLQIEIPETGSCFLGYTNSHASSFVNALLALSRRHFKGNVMVRKCMDEIFQLAQKADGYSVLSIHILLAQILQSVITSADSAKIYPDKSLRIESVKKYIDDHLASALSIQILADRHHISESHFKKWFKAEVGVTPMDYIQRRKIEVAKNSLSSHQEFNVTDIAYQLNFSSSQYFATVFKKYAGVTPLEYRNGNYAQA
jgi:AraC-like DNA-binding protein/mannose-6-phosphate isomerase-like protein (cupin superfamily)